MSTSRTLSGNKLFVNLGGIFDQNHSPTLYAEGLLESLATSTTFPLAHLNTIIFLLEAFTPIEDACSAEQLDEAAVKTVMRHWSKILKKRFRVIQDFPILQYQHTPSTLINRLSIEMAGLCEKYLETGRYQLLFPMISSAESMLTATSLSEVALAVTDIVLTDDASGFIEVENCLANAVEDGELKHTQEAALERAGEDIVGVKLRPMSESEKLRVVSHNAHTEKLFAVIQQLRAAKNNHATLGGCLRALIDGMRDGSSHRVS